MGKGSAPRPITDREQYEKNWDAIFGKKEKLDPPDANQHPNCAHPFCACEVNCRAPGNDR